METILSDTVSTMIYFICGVTIALVIISAIEANRERKRYQDIIDKYGQYSEEYDELTSDWDED